MAAAKVNKAIAALVDETKLKANAEFAEFLKENGCDDVDELLSKFSDTKIAEKEKTKKPPTAYRLFLEEKMKELKTANPPLTGRAAMVAAAEAWNEHKKQNGVSDKPKADKGKGKAAKPTKIEIVTDSEAEDVDDTARNTSDSDDDDDKKVSPMPTIKEGKGKAKIQGKGGKGLHLKK